MESKAERDIQSEEDQSQTEPHAQEGQTAQTDRNGVTLDDLLRQQAEINQATLDLGMRQGFMVQQLGQILAAVNQQQEDARVADQAFRQDITRLQRNASQRAMAAIFHKFFRDLLGIMNQLDDLIETGAAAEPDSDAASWNKSLRLLRGNAETILADWGCTPIEVDPHITEFDPDLHEAVPMGMASENSQLLAGEPKPENTIIMVKRRGWRLHDHILQYPQVIVS